MSSSRASGHDGEGSSGGFEELGEDISLGLAGADVWIVFVNVLNDLLFESSFEGEVVEGSEGLPKVGTEGKDGASKGVKSLEEVEAEISSHSHDNTLDEETSGVGHFVGGVFPSGLGHWDGGTFASIGYSGSAFLEHIRHCEISFCYLLIITF